MGIWKHKIQKAAPTPIPAPTQTPVPATNDRKADATEMDRMETFVPVTPRRRLRDLVVPPAVKQQIDTALNRIRYHEVLYEEWNLKQIDPFGRRIAINLYGPPGTGKTFCAEAIAHHLQQPLITVNYAEIESKYVGETPKNIKAAFKKARAGGAVLFFDEADSILGKRLTHVTQSADHGVNVSRSVMLMELDNFDGVVLFASNLPRNYDGAFIRRILAHIQFELPNADGRFRLWRALLPDETPRASDLTFEWLTEASQGLSGGDILNVVKLAASQAVTRTGTERCIKASDIQTAIGQVNRAKAHIGSSDTRDAIAGDRAVRVLEEVVSPNQLPPETRSAYLKQVGQQDEPIT